MNNFILFLKVGLYSKLIFEFRKQIFSVKMTYIH